jgi:hypothetical protein
VLDFHLKRSVRGPVVARITVTQPSGVTSARRVSLLL